MTGYGSLNGLRYFDVTATAPDTQGGSDIVTFYPGSWPGGTNIEVDSSDATTTGNQTGSSVHGAHCAIVGLVVVAASTAAADPTVSFVDMAGETLIETVVDETLAVGDFLALTNIWSTALTGHAGSGLGEGTGLDGPVPVHGLDAMFGYGCAISDEATDRLVIRVWYRLV